MSGRWLLLSRTINLIFERRMPYYAVAKGRQVGIFPTWEECSAQVTKFQNPIFKKFTTLSDAESFISAKTGTAFKHTTPKATQVKESFVEPSGSLPSGDWPDDDSENDDYLLIAAAETAGDVAKRTTKRKPPPVAGSSKRAKYESVIWKPTGTKKFGKHDFPVDSEDFVIVYTDGSCIDNGKTSAIAGFGVYFSENHPLNTAKPVSGRATNNCGEIQAASYAIKVAKENGIPKLCISTDSQFLINSITKWISSWKSHGWRLKSGQPVKNKDDFMELDNLLRDKGIKIKWNYVKGHDGIEGNEKADKLARQGAAIYGNKHKA